MDEGKKGIAYVRWPYTMRDPQGKFLGTLEMTQDATEICKLEGERRLLDEVK